MLYTKRLKSDLCNVCIYILQPFCQNNQDNNQANNQANNQDNYGNHDKPIIMINNQATNQVIAAH